MNDNEFYFDVSKFQAEIMTMRGNFMLIFQSMLLSTVAILHTRQQPFDGYIYLLILGLVTDIIWLYMNHLTKIVEAAAWKKLLEGDERVKELIKNRPFGELKWAGNIAWFMAYPFPLLLSILWIIQLYFHIK